MVGAMWVHLKPEILYLLPVVGALPPLSEEEISLSLKNLSWFGRGWFILLRTHPPHLSLFLELQPDSKRVRPLQLNHGAYCLGYRTKYAVLSR